MYRWGHVWVKRGCSVETTVCYTGGRCTGGDMYGCHIAVALRLWCTIQDVHVGIQVGTCTGVTWL